MGFLLAEQHLKLPYRQHLEAQQEAAAAAVRDGGVRGLCLHSHHQPWSFGCLQRRLMERAQMNEETMRSIERQAAGVKFLRLIAITVEAE